ncbi:MAG: type II toxin-antitoxin system VapC family toxin [Acidobacteriaceae bacterium]
MTKPTAFWDASALVPLCVQEATTGQVRRHLRRFAPVVWWGSVVEAHSAISRLHRETAIAPSECDGALARLTLLGQGWREILPDDALWNLAGTLLDAYALRAADSLQLAAALIWCRQRPEGKTFICGDRRLSNAAKSAGFSVAELSRRTR